MVHQLLGWKSRLQKMQALYIAVAQQLTRCSLFTPLCIMHLLLVLLQVCLGAVAPSPGWGHWMGQLSGMQGAMNGLRYINCCARQLGEYVRPVFADARPPYGHVLLAA